MSQLDQTTIHEAGHVTAWILEEEHLGPLKMATVLPSADGRIAGLVYAGDTQRKLKTERARRAYGRMLAAGDAAVRLAGFEPHGYKPPGAEGDADHLAALARESKHPERFTRQAIAGAEFTLRCHWGAVKRMAAALRACDTLSGTRGQEIARSAVYGGPPESHQATDLDVFTRLSGELHDVPEIRAQILEGVASVRESQASPATSRRRPRYSRGSGRGQAARA
jgi:hypothetical protein